MLHSCSEDLLDINQDPNTSTQLSPCQTHWPLPRYPWFPIFLVHRNTNAGSFSRMWYNDCHQKLRTNQGTYSSSWVNLYSQELWPQPAGNPGWYEEGASGYKGIARLLKAYTFSLFLVDLYGDVLTSKPLNPEITFPGK